jgi:hypothetical protein
VHPFRFSISLLARSPQTGEMTGSLRVPALYRKSICLKWILNELKMLVIVGAGA